MFERLMKRKRLFPNVDPLRLELSVITVFRSTMFNPAAERYCLSVDGCCGAGGGTREDV